MDPTTQSEDFESFMARERMQRGTSIGSKGAGGFADNNSLGTTSIGRMGDIDELLELDMGFGNDGPLLDLFMNQATEIGSTTLLLTATIITAATVGIVGIITTTTVGIVGIVTTTTVRVIGIVTTATVGVIGIITTATVGVVGIVTTATIVIVRVARGLIRWLRRGLVRWL